MQIKVGSLAAPGFDGLFEAARLWPASGVITEVVDSEEDPEGGGVLRIGRNTLRLLQENPRISLSPVEAIEDIAAMKVKLEAALARVAELEAAAGESSKQTEMLMAASVADAPKTKK